MRSDDLDFLLPPELIAQTPPAERHDARLMHYRMHARSIAHRTFSDLPSLLRAGDLLVFNDARVLPARLMLRKSTGGHVEGLFLEETAPGAWRVLLKNLGSHPVGMTLEFPGAGGTMRVIERREGGEFLVTIDPPAPAADVLARAGRMPLPPYIKRHKEHDERDDLDRQRYQTVFAKSGSAVAAPTAALHFSDALLARLDAAGVQRTFVTLDVGMGTFKPVTADRLDDHVMHVESYTISPEAAAALNAAKQHGRRIIAVGTTSARVLESQPAGEPFTARHATTGIFIRPPYEWKHVVALITNFHLPRSTLIALVAAFTGIDEQRRLYAQAIAERYRFFSYGDGMFLDR